MDIERGEDVKFRLILVGKSGGGKSATGNTILGHKAFDSILAVRNTTLRCQKGEGNWQGAKISVVDTPGLFDSEDYTEIVRREIMDCLQLSWPGPHALILVTQVGRFSAEDAAAAKYIQDIFGAESTKCTIVVFTCLEDLGGEPLREYVQKSDNRNLRDLIRQCGNRFCGFNNKAVGAERERQVSELMAMVQSVVFENRGGYYVNQLYLEPDLQDEHVKMFVEQNRNARRRLQNKVAGSLQLTTAREPQKGESRDTPPGRCDHRKDEFVDKRLNFDPMPLGCCDRHKYELFNKCLNFDPVTPGRCDHCKYESFDKHLNFDPGTQRTS